MLEQSLSLNRVSFDQSRAIPARKYKSPEAATPDDTGTGASAEAGGVSSDSVLADMLSVPVPVVCANTTDGIAVATTAATSTLRSHDARNRIIDFFRILFVTFKAPPISPRFTRGRVRYSSPAASWTQSLRRRHSLALKSHHCPATLVVASAFLWSASRNSRLNRVCSIPICLCKSHSNLDRDHEQQYIP